MKKTEIQKLNKLIKRLKMADIEKLSKSHHYRLGYKAGWNTVRRRTRKALGL